MMMTAFHVSSFIVLVGGASVLAVAIGDKSHLNSRDEINSTLLNTTVVQDLDFTSNCTLATSWYNNLPPSDGAGSGNDTINIDFLRSALPTEYQNETDAQISRFYDDMSTGDLSALGWLGTAKDDIETSCLTPQFEREVSLTTLDPTQNCTATAIFLGSLGWITGVQNYTASKSNDPSWLNFLLASLPPHGKNLTDLELLVYRNYFLAAENTAAITIFLKRGFDACQKDICEVQGYTGNPDIGGIGVISSYTVEAALVTLYFVAVNLQIWMEGAGYKDKIPPHMSKALEKASDELADGALFFSLSISTAGWVSFVSGTSYYEKLVFTSANVLALSALFAFLGLFTQEGRKRRGEYILALMVACILTESAIQYIVYLREPNDRYKDYACLHLQFQDEGYHPTIFEALFFILLGLSVLAGIVGIIWLLRRPKSQEDGKTGSWHSDANAKIHVPGRGTDLVVKVNTIEAWVVRTRILIQTVAIAVMWVELIYLWKIRGIMSRIAGATWTEGSWGFGQILALFVWLPPIVDILGWLLLPEWMLGGDKPRKCTCGSEKDGHPCTCSTGLMSTKAGPNPPVILNNGKTNVIDEKSGVEETSLPTVQLDNFSERERVIGPGSGQ